jgi:hypothetical protein
MATKPENDVTVVDFDPLQAKPQMSAFQQQTPLEYPRNRFDEGSSVQDMSHGRKRKNPYSREYRRKVIRGGPKSLGLPQIDDSEDASSSFILRDESPWDTYRRALNCKLAGTVIIAVHCNRPSRIIAIREYSGDDADKMIQRFRHFNHPNILSARECYTHGSSMYALVEDLPLTLEHLVGCRNLYPNEAELASMIWQVFHLPNCKRLHLLTITDP